MPVMTHQGTVTDFAAGWRWNVALKKGQHCWIDPQGRRYSFRTGDEDTPHNIPVVRSSLDLSTVRPLSKPVEVP